MTGTQSVKLYRLFQRLTKNDAEAEAFVQEVAAVVEDKFEQKKDLLAIKENLLATKDDLRSEIRQVVGQVRDLEVKMGDFKAEIIKWMFLFWAGSILTTLGALYGFLKAFSLPR